MIGDGVINTAAHIGIIFHSLHVTACRRPSEPGGDPGLPDLQEGHPDARRCLLVLPAGGSRPGLFVRVCSELLPPLIMSHVGGCPAAVPQKPSPACANRIFISIELPRMRAGWQSLLQGALDAHECPCGVSSSQRTLGSVHNATCARLSLTCMQMTADVAEGGPSSSSCRPPICPAAGDRIWRPA